MSDKPKAELKILEFKKPDQPESAHVQLLENMLEYVKNNEMYATVIIAFPKNDFNFLQQAGVQDRYQLYGMLNRWLRVIENGEYEDD